MGLAVWQVRAVCSGKIIGNLSVVYSFVLYGGLQCGNLWRFRVWEACSCVAQGTVESYEQKNRGREFRDTVPLMRFFTSVGTNGGLLCAIF